ncbi:MAG: hypothetical protein AAGG44_00090 [Planctomycetota bacterium]
MWDFFGGLAKKWTSWIGDRDMELALRKHLDSQGFYGDTARFENLRLAAVQRPGWLQVFVFSVEVRERSERNSSVQLHGIVRQDERYNKTDIRTFSAKYERNSLFSEWSEDLIRLRGARL